MVYSPGTLETDPKKQNMALQQQASAIKTTNANVATNTANIATNTANIATKITGPNSSTVNAAVRFDGTTGKLAQDSALIIADSTGSLSRTGGGGIPLQGTNTNDNAASGYVGEEIRRAVASGSAIALTTSTAANINYVDLTAGDWIVGGNIVFLAGSGMISTEYHVCTDLVSAAINSDESAHAFHTTFTASQSAIIPSGAKRYSLSASTRIYMNCTQTFSGGTLSGYGTMWARRMR